MNTELEELERSLCVKCPVCKGRRTYVAEAINERSVTDAWCRGCGGSGLFRTMSVSSKQKTEIEYYPWRETPTIFRPPFTTDPMPSVRYGWLIPGQYRKLVAYVGDTRGFEGL